MVGIHLYSLVALNFLQCRKFRFISIPFSYRYITRFKIKDSSRHVILGSQQFKPLEFANQINLSMDNAWGIVRCIIDLVMQQKDGKVFLNKLNPHIRNMNAIWVY